MNKANTNNETQDRKKGFFKIIIRLLLAVILLFFSTVLVLRTEFVQTYLAKIVSKRLSERTGFPIGVKSVYIDGIESAEIYDVSLNNPEGDTIIYIQNLDVKYSIIELLSDESPSMDATTFYRPVVRLRMKNKAELLGLSRFIRLLRGDKEGSKGQSQYIQKTPFITFKNLRIVDGEFSYENFNRDPMNDDKRFDHNYFYLNEVNADVSEFYVQNDTLHFNISHLSGKEKYKDYHVYHLGLVYEYSPRHMSFEGISGDVENSCIGENLHFAFNSPEDLQHFNDSVYITSKLKNCEIDAHDLAFFAPGLWKYNDRWRVNASFEGKVNDFKAKSLRASFGKNSQVRGDLAVTGFSKIDSADFVFNIARHRIHASDLHTYTPRSSHAVLDSLSRLDGHFVFEGKTNDFTVEGAGSDAAGGELEYVLSLNTKEKSSVYSLDLKSESYNISKIYRSPYFRSFSGEIHCHGQGFNKEDATVYYKATFDSWSNRKTSFKNLNVSGIYNKGSFTSNVVSKDSSLYVDLTTIFDKSNNAENLKIKGSLDTVDLYKLNLNDEQLKFGIRQIELDIKGDHIDEFEGTGEAKDLYCYTRNDTAAFEHFKFYSELDNKYRHLLVNSDIFNAEISGDFSYHSLYKELELSAKEINYLFQNDTISLNKIEREKEKYDSLIYNIDFNAHFADVNDVVHLFTKEVYVAPNSHAYGFYNKSAPSKKLIAEFKTNKIRYKDFTLDDVRMSANRSKSKEDSVFSADFELTSSKQYFKSKPYYENLDLITRWAGSEMSFDLYMKQFEKPNFIDLKGTSLFEKNATNIHLNESKISLLRKAWNIDKNNVIRVNKNEILFDSLVFRNDDQRIILDGLLSNKRRDSAFVQFDNFELNNFDAFIDTELDGKVDGSLRFFDVQDKISANSFIKVDSFKVNNQYLGNLNGSVDWSTSSSILGLNLNLIYSKKNSLKLTGTYDISNDDSPLDITARLKGLEINFIEAFLGDIVSDMKGKMYGNVTINGTLNEPKFYGKPKVRNGGLRINYLNTYYEFDDQVIFNQDSIYVAELEMFDPLWNTKSYVSGGIRHDLFRNINIFLEANLYKSYVLNTTIEQNQLYYGQAFATGNVILTGTPNKLFLTSNSLSSDNGTKLSIPINSRSSVVDNKDFIIFESSEPADADTLQEELLVQEPEKNKSVFGMDVNFNINQNAEFEIIFDDKTGDIIRGYGEGDIIMKINEQDDFTLYGDYQFKKGTYNFTLANLINKAFKIEPGSQISWNGDPYNGVLDVDAVYTVHASLAPILTVDSTFYQDHPEAKRRVPVDVGLMLNGKLLNPEIQFSVDIRQYPNLIEIEQAVIDLESRMTYNEQLLNQEVFSLMVLKQLTPVGQINVNVASSGANSVSELLSNQFSYWISQFDENLEVYIDVSGFDKDEANSFSLSMSYSILDGRVRITNQGSFTNVEDQNDIANVFGDWTLEYLITDDGKMRIKAYNKTNQNTVSTTLSNDNSTVYGASLLYTTGFDNFRELFKSNKNKEQVSSFPEDSTKTLNRDKIQTDSLSQDSTSNSPVQPGTTDDSAPANEEGAKDSKKGTLNREEEDED